VCEREEENACSKEVKSVYERENKKKKRDRGKEWMKERERERERCCARE